MNKQHIHFYWRFKVLLIFLVLCWGGKQPLRAQYYPIHATVQWPSPQSPYLSDYYSGSRDRLIVNLLNRDLQQPLLFARLRIRIKSTGFLATSREEINYPMLELSANVPTRLTNIDLSPYLQPQNLQINGRLHNGQLPTGYTEFSVQVVDYYTGRTLSAWHTGRSYLDVKKPPILNFPEKDARIGVTEPLYLRFQWMPRHQGLAGTVYEFVLKELPNNGAAPQSAFAYGNEIYRVRTRNTTLNYTHLDPVLFPNRCYAWQVQAIARDGVDEVGMFENGGYSEINWFYLTDDCQAPTGLRAHPRFAKVDLSWNKVIGTTGYVVECRPKGKFDNYEWSRTQIVGEHLTLAQLKLGWTYEWRVGTLCTDDHPVFSGVSEFTLSKQNEELLADCGKEPVRKDLSQEPNLRIKAGDIVTIGGDYPMTIIEAVPLGDGWYSGRGKTRLKTIIDAPVALRFDRLRINVDNFQIDGTVEASYDEKKGKIANLDYVDDGGKDVKPASIRMREHKLDFTLPDIPQFTYNPETGEIETTDVDGTPHTIKIDVQENGSYESIFPMLVTDKKNSSYQLRVYQGVLQAKSYIYSSNVQTENSIIDESRIPVITQEERLRVDSIRNNLYNQIKTQKYEKIIKINAIDTRYLNGAFQLVEFLANPLNINLTAAPIGTSRELVGGGSYTGILNVATSSKVCPDDIKITLFHEFLHHVNYVLKIFPIRYQDEKGREIFTIDKTCKDQRSKIEAYEDYAILNGLPDSIQKLTPEQKEKFEKAYKEEGWDSTYITRRIYQPSNASQDEYSVHSLCLKQEPKLFLFSQEKKMLYMNELTRYKDEIRKYRNFEIQNKYTSAGYETK